MKPAMVTIALAGGLCLSAAMALYAASPPQKGFDADIARHAQAMIDEGRKTFRYDTFGSEAFWGDALQLHKAIAGEKSGGVGPGVSPKTALAVGLKVDVDALPDALKKQLKAGKINLDDPATTGQVDGHPVRLLSFDRRQPICAGHRQAARWLG